MLRRPPGPTFEASGLREAVELAADLRVTSRCSVAVRPTPQHGTWTVTILEGPDDELDAASGER